MCNPILFTCHSCGLKHNYKLNPCRRARASLASPSSSTPTSLQTSLQSPFSTPSPQDVMCPNARLISYRVACDQCKDRWKNARREERREEEREMRRRASSVATRVPGSSGGVFGGFHQEAGAAGASQGVVGIGMGLFRGREGDLAVDPLLLVNGNGQADGLQGGAGFGGKGSDLPFRR